MIPVPGFEGRKVAVLGLARSGRAAAAALEAGGAEVLAWDDSEKTRSGIAAELNLRDLTKMDWRGVAAMMLSLTDSFAVAASSGRPKARPPA